MTRAANRVLHRPWAWLAWVALAMLAAQPASAAITAQPRGQTILVELCSTHSTGKSVAIHLPGAPDQKPECAKCPSCLTAPLGARPQTPLVMALAVAYQVLNFSPDHEADVGLARAPPRPPGQGPPAIPKA